LIVVTSAIGGAGISCSSDGDPESLPSIAQVSVTSTSTTVVTTTTLPSVDPQLVSDCVEYVMFGAFTQNPLLTSMWDAADHDPAALRDDCISLGRTDPGALAALSQGLADLNVLLQSTTTSTTNPLRVTPTTSTTEVSSSEVPVSEVPSSEVASTDVPTPPTSDAAEEPAATVVEA
jgi:hypothetical protein